MVGTRLSGKASGGFQYDDRLIYVNVPIASRMLLRVAK
jgi:hypothetical protein